MKYFLNTLFAINKQNNSSRSFGVDIKIVIMHLMHKLLSKPKPQSQQQNEQIYRVPRVYAVQSHIGTFVISTFG